MNTCHISHKEMSSLLTKMELLYGSFFTRSYMKNLSKTQVIEEWLDTLGHYPWATILKVIDLLKIPNGQFSKFPPNLLEFNNECFNFCKISSLQEAKKSFYGTYKIRQAQINSLFSVIDERNRNEEFWASLEGREPNVVKLSDYEIKLIKETQATEPYTDPYIKYLLLKNEEYDLYYNFDKIYHRHLKDYIATYEK